MEKLEITVNEMMADDGPAPKDLENACAHGARWTQNDQDASNDTFYDGMERIPSWHRSRKERTNWSRTVVSWQRSS